MPPNRNASQAVCFSRQNVPQSISKIVMKMQPDTQPTHIFVKPFVFPPQMHLRFSEKSQKPTEISKIDLNPNVFLFQMNPCFTNLESAKTCIPFEKIEGGILAVQSASQSAGHRVLNILIE